MARAPGRVHVDAVLLETSAAGLMRRAVRNVPNATAVDIAISCLDLHTLGGGDSPGHVRSVCAQAVAPAAGAPSVAAVCVSPSLIATAKDALHGTTVRVACAATLADGHAPLRVKIAGIRAARHAGADEVDFAVDGARLFSGDAATMLAEIVAARDACEGATLNVVIDAFSLGTYATARRAADLALGGGADFLKTAGAPRRDTTTPAIALLFCHAVRHHSRATGRRAGIKVAGAVRSLGAALGYLALAAESLGEDWLDPRSFRIAGSAILADAVAARA
jgi:deoxyribose-phosphate aldolase